MSWQSQTLGDILERHARERPKAEALVTPKRRITYEDLNLRARSAAATLHSLGLRRGDHVGILMGNDEKWLALFYGAAMIGAVTGWRTIPGVLLLAAISGAVIGVPAALRSGRGMQAALPFGIFLGIAFLAALFFGHTLSEWYFSLMLR